MCASDKPLRVRLRVSIHTRVVLLQRVRLKNVQCAPAMRWNSEFRPLFVMNGKMLLISSWPSQTFRNRKKRGDFDSLSRLLEMLVFYRRMNCQPDSPRSIVEVIGLCYPQPAAMKSDLRKRLNLKLVLSYWKLEYLVCLLSSFMLKVTFSANL